VSAEKISVAPEEHMGVNGEFGATLLALLFWFWARLQLELGSWSVKCSVNPLRDSHTVVPILNMAIKKLSFGLESNLE
jgi:hypothetical protein